MEWSMVKGRLTEYAKQYRYVLLSVLIGICLMLIPEDREIVAEEPVIPAETTLEDSLSRLLSRLEGAGEVQVLLTEAQGSTTYYQCDEVTDGTELKRDTVLITDNDRNEAGLVRKADSPVYRGAVVLCQGADDAQVRLDIVQAVKNATGLSADRISVLKMK